MGDFSYVQSNFFGGRWSQNMQGRMDDPRYKIALAECLNAYPSEEGAFLRRSGFESLGVTKDGAVARLMPFRFSSIDPYIAEFTDASLRLWQDDRLVLADNHFVYLSAADASTPTVFTCQEQNQNGTGVDYNEGDYVIVMNISQYGTGASKYPTLSGPKVYILANVTYTAQDSSPNFTCNLVNPVTNIAISAGVLAALYAGFKKVLTLASPFSQDQLSAIRKVQSAGDKAGQYSAGAVEQVSFLHPQVRPQLLQTTQPFSRGLQPFQFRDGPYLDQPDTQIPLQPSGTSGVINLAVIGWIVSSTYAVGDAVAYNNLIYFSLVANNLGHTPPAIADGFWVAAPTDYDAGATYTIGCAVIFGGFLWFSLVDSNTGNQPDVSPSDWSSALAPVWAIGTTYAKAAYVSYSGTTYASIASSNIGNQPDVSPTDWLPIDITSLSAEVEQLLAGFTFSAGDIGRHIRLQAAPPPWVQSQTYALGALVTYNGNIYLSLISSNTGLEPDINPVSWQIQNNLPAWTWGVITGGGGQVLITSIPAWNSGTNYAQYVMITYNGYVYFADNQSGHGNGSNVGMTPLAFALTQEEAKAGSNTLWWIGLAAAVNGGLPAQPWQAQVYNYLDVVTYIGSTWVCVHTSVGGQQIPGVSIYWKALSGGTTGVDQSPYSITVSILGPNLPNTQPIYAWRLGVYCNATGWPSCGAYHEGRLWLNGPIPNRFDASIGNDPFYFAPTAYDGTVSDNNAISETLNSGDSEEIKSFASNTNGITIYTATGEWLISASQLDDPITPTSIQARKVTAFGCYNAENVRLPTAQAVIHGLTKKVLEHKIFIDTSSYSQLYSANDMAHVCKDLSAPGVNELAWQQEPVQNLWSRCADGSFFGIGYKREPELTYAAPHKHIHGAGDSLTSFAVQLDATGIDEHLCGCFSNAGVYDVQKLHDPFVPGDALSGAFMVDRGVQASGMAPSSTWFSAQNWQIKFLGLDELAGQTVHLCLAGVDWGTIAVAADGTAILTVLPSYRLNPDNSFTGDGPLNPYVLIQAFNWQTLGPYTTLTELLTDYGGPFPATPSSPANYVALMTALFTLVSQGVDASDPDFPGKTILDNSVSAEYGSLYGGTFWTDYVIFPVTCNAVFGFPYVSQGQMLRPVEGGQNGPAFAKTRRNDRAGLFVSNTNEVSIGTDFAHLHPLPLTFPDRVTPAGPTDLVTGIFRDSVESDYDYDGMLCWQFTACYPGAVLAAGGFADVVDI